MDDNRDTVETLALLLKDFGHEVEIAYDGAGALKKVREMAPHLILLDIGLPGMDGYQIARRLRQDPETSGTILVALTGYGQPRDRERTRECGFDAHFVKPIGIDALVQYIDDACKQSGSA